jgi:ribonuclease PH
MPRTRPHDALRPIEIVTGFLERNPASVLYSSGATKVLCLATLERTVPPFLAGSGQGWTTAEYDMLPGATSPRHPRERSGKLSGRTQEIQRLIGRSLRGVMDLSALDGWTLQLDCDVLQADGGTRTASVNGAYIAAALTIAAALEQGLLLRSPLRQPLGAVSAGVVAGQPLLDLDYEEDAAAEVDLNVVLAASGAILEIQATTEDDAHALTRSDLDRLLDMAARGIREILGLQAEVIERALA